MPGITLEKDEYRLVLSFGAAGHRLGRWVAILTRTCWSSRRTTWVSYSAISIEAALKTPEWLQAKPLDTCEIKSSTTHRDRRIGPSAALTQLKSRLANLQRELIAGCATACSWSRLLQIDSARRYCRSPLRRLSLATAPPAAPVFRLPPAPLSLDWHVADTV